MDHKEKNILLIETLIEEAAPKSTLAAIGAAFKEFSAQDIKEIGTTLLAEDLTPYLSHLKMNAMTTANKTKNYLTQKNLFSNIKSDARALLNNKKPLNDTKILIPETQKRLNEFVSNISRDFSLLKTDEERGKYILKLAAYTSVFIVSFQTGANFSGPFKKNHFFRKTLLPVMFASGSLTLINRVLEQAQKKMGKTPEAAKVAGEIRKFTRIVNVGIGSGMTIAAIADGLTQTNITVKGRVDTLVHSTILALFSKDIPDKPEQ